MKFLKNYQNDWKGKSCDHIFSVLEEKRDFVIQQGIRCFKLEEREKTIEN